MSNLSTYDEVRPFGSGSWLGKTAQIDRPMLICAYIAAFMPFPISYGQFNPERPSKAGGWQLGSRFLHGPSPRPVNMGQH